MKKKLILLIPIILGVMAIGAGVLTYLLSQPKEVVEEGNLANIEWYSLEEKEFTIDTVEEFYEFAKLSQFYDFKKQTVKLGADLVFNEGSAADWEKEAPANKWYGIQGFAGTFDGQGHSISGVYSLKHSGLVGLFLNTQPNCKITDFRLVNSYFEADGGNGIGSVVANGGGNFSNIYSDAIVISNHNDGTGGLIGNLSSGGASSFMAYTHSINNCWFDGQVRMTDLAEGMRGGGIVGVASNGTLSIEHCLNTGKVSTTINHVGGIVGFILNNSGCAVHVKDTFNSGVIEVPSDRGATAAIIGRVGSGVSAVLENTAATIESYKVGAYADGSLTGYVISRPKKDLTGYGGYKWTNLDFDNYWAIRMEDTPILKYFADDIPDLSGVVKEFDTTWYSASQAEFEITTRAQLIGLNLLSNETDFAGQTIKLGADIVFNEGKAKDWEKEAPSYEWTPIAKFVKPFKGIIDGQGHSISGLYIKDSATGTAFIRCMNEDAAIKNIKFLNGYVESTHTSEDGASIVGGIAGRAAGTFENVYSNMIVKAVGGYTGGFVGQSAGAMTIKNCWFDGSVTVTGEKSQLIGGFVGTIQNPVERVIEHCLFTGVVTIPSNHGGGIVGNISPEKLSLTIRDCLSVGSVISEKGYTEGVGAIIGRVRKLSTVTITTTTAAKETTKKAIHMDGDASLNGSVFQVAREQIVGNGGYEWTELDFKNYWTIVATGTPVLKTFAKKTLSTQGLARKIDTTWYDPTKDTYVIDSLAKLNGFNTLAQTNDFAGKTIKLGADIVVNSGDAKEWKNLEPEYKWLPACTFIAPFKGTFDGQGHTISGLYIKDDATGAALFRCTSEDSVIKNFKLVNSYIESTVEKDNAAIMGTIAGRGSGTFEKIYSDAILVSYGGYAGGFIGQCADQMDMSNCWFDGSLTVTGESSVWIGGLVGIVQNPAKRTIAHCLNTATITGPGNQIGGLCGMVTNEGNQVIITDSFNAGLVSAGNPNAIGSIIGRLSGKAVANVTTTAATSESCGTAIYKDANVTLNGGVLQKSKDLLTGNDGYLWTELDFTNYWSIVEGGTPILKAFAKTSPAVTGTRMVDTSWYKAEASTYDIDTIAKLNGLSVLAQGNNFADKIINLKANLTLNSGDAADWETTVPTYSWTPIGGFRNPFMGTFNGNGHTIEGLYTNVTEGAGLFTCIGETGKVSDLKITNSYIKGGLIVGGLAGRGAGIYENIYVNAIVTSTADGYTGGIIGQGTNTLKMTNCQNAGPVTTEGNGSKVAGLIGCAQGAKTEIYNCLNTGTIVCAAKSHVGGLIGYAAYGELIMDSCLNTGDVNAKSGAAGSIIGRVQGNNSPITASITNTYATSESCNNTIYTDINAVINGVKMEKGGNVAGVVDAYGTDVLRSYGSVVYTKLDFENYWTAIKGAPAQLQDYASGEELTVTADMIPDTSWYDESKSEFVIDTVGKLYGFQQLSKTKNFQGKTVKLAQSFTFTTEDVKTIQKENILWPWAAISPSTCAFAGTFDGQDNTLSGIYTSGDKFIGLFGKIAGGTVKNLKIENSYFAGSQHQVGSIAGVASGTFENIDVNATVSATGGHVGGFFGQHLEGALAMTDCHFAGAVSSGSSIVGGFIGTNGGTTTTMTNCSNSATVDAQNGNQAGGFIGRGQDGAVVQISNSVNDGKVTATKSDVGGFVGWMTSGSLTITGSRNEKEIYGGTHTTGGFVGNVNGTVTITDCVNNGNVTGNSGQQVGGIIGNAQPVVTVERTTNNGNVKAGYSNAGGMVGQIYGATSVTINGCTNTGAISVTSDLNCGGLIGYLRSTTNNITRSTNTGAVSGNYDRIGGLVGMVDLGGSNTTINECKNSGAVTSPTTTNNRGIGGVVGQYNAGASLRIINTANTGAVSLTGGSNGFVLGGIIGRVSGSGTSLEHCLNSGALTSKQASHLGGLIGHVGVATSINDCFNSGKLNGNAGAVGSIIGRVQGGVTVTVTNTYATTDSCAQQIYIDGTGVVTDGTTTKTGGGSVTGIVGANSAANYTGIKAYTNAPNLDWTTYWTPMAQGTPQLKSHIDGIALDVAWYNTNKTASTISIATAEQLMTYNDMVAASPSSYLSKNVNITADITINEGNNDDWAAKAPKYTWTPLFNWNADAFAGTFDGGGHTISGLYTKGSANGAGLFKCIAAGTKVQNLKLVNSYFSGGSVNGAIAGRAAGEFTNLYVDAIVVSTGVGENGGYIGGIIGQSVGPITLTKCWNAGTVTTTDATAYKVGGLIGSAQGDTTNIYHSLNSGAITCPYKTHIGGLIGYLASGTATIEDSLNTGNLNTHSGAAGSIIGRVQGGKAANVTNTYATTESCTGATVYGDSTAVIKVNGTTTGATKVGQLPSANLTREAAKTNGGATGLNWATYWKTTTGFPILNGFGF